MYVYLYICICICTHIYIYMISDFFFKYIPKVDGLILKMTEDFPNLWAPMGIAEEKFVPRFREARKSAVRRTGGWCPPWFRFTP